MRYIYILCMILSSIFTYKQTYAQNTINQYAFYMPQNSFQNNTDIAKRDYLRHTRIDARISPSTEEYEEEEKPVQTIKNPETQKYLKAQNEKMLRIAKKLKKYQLGDDRKTTLTIPPKKKKVAKKTTPIAKKIVKPIIAKIQIKTIADTLSDLPYPDNTLPNFQQAYAEYIMDLRSLYYNKRLPINSKQEASLSKANSILRFTVN